MGLYKKGIELFPSFLGFLTIQSEVMKTLLERC